MKTIVSIALAAGMLAVAPAQAAEIAHLYGTWECRVPGGVPTKTPPIVWLAPATGAQTGKLVVDVDGFSRDIVGVGEVVALDGGWFKVSPPQGQAFLIREAVAPRGRRAPSMELKRGETGASYRCLRLPNRDELPSSTRKN